MAPISECQALGTVPEFYEYYFLYFLREPYKAGIINPILQIRNTGLMRLNDLPKVRDAINGEASITRGVCPTPGLFTITLPPSPVLFFYTNPMLN